MRLAAVPFEGNPAAVCLVENEKVRLKWFKFNSALKKKKNKSTIFITSFV